MKYQKLFLKGVLKMKTMPVLISAYILICGIGLLASHDSSAAPYTENNVCGAEFCATDPATAQTCNTFLTNCLAVTTEANSDECVAGSLVICQNPDVQASDVCNYQLCGTNDALRQECIDFLSVCVAESVNAEECVGAMLFKCRGK